MGLNKIDPTQPIDDRTNRQMTSSKRGTTIEKKIIELKLMTGEQVFFFRTFSHPASVLGTYNYVYSSTGDHLEQLKHIERLLREMEGENRTNRTELLTTDNYSEYVPPDPTDKKSKSKRPKYTDPAKPKNDGAIVPYVNNKRRRANDPIGQEGSLTRSAINALQNVAQPMVRPVSLLSFGRTAAATAADGYYRTAMSPSNDPLYREIRSNFLNANTHHQSNNVTYSASGREIGSDALAIGGYRAVAADEISPFVSDQISPFVADQISPFVVANAEPPILRRPNDDDVNVVEKRKRSETERETVPGLESTIHLSTVNRVDIIVRKIGQNTDGNLGGGIINRGWVENMSELVHRRRVVRGETWTTSDAQSRVVSVRQESDVTRFATDDEIFDLKSYLESQDLQDFGNIPYSPLFYQPPSPMFSSFG